MTRTTIDLDPHVLRQLKERQRHEGRTMGQLASELLARALAKENEPTEVPALDWPVQDMGALIDIDDKEEVYSVLDDRTGER